jgi:hypothetical protein
MGRFGGIVLLTSHPAEVRMPSVARLIHTAFRRLYLVAQGLQKKMHYDLDLAEGRHQLTRGPCSIAANDT